MIDEYSRFPWAFPCKDMVASTVIKCLSDLFSIFGLAAFIHSDNGPLLVCEELRTFLLGIGVAYSNTSVYNPRGNGQCERFNGTIWKSAQLAMKTKNLQQSQWESVLPSVLHSLRTLVCTSTNQTPHERLFNFRRKIISGHALPKWLLQKGPVLLRNHNRQSKYDDICEEVELVNVTPTYAQIKLASGREQTVSLRDLAPLPQPERSDQSAVELSPPDAHQPLNDPKLVPSRLDANNHELPSSSVEATSELAVSPPVVQVPQSEPTVPIRRSDRVRKQTEFFESALW